MHKYCNEFTKGLLIFAQCLNIHWHLSTTVVYKWWHLADCKVSRFTKQPKINVVNKHAPVTNVSAGKQHMALDVCRSEYLSFSFLICLTQAKGLLPRSLNFSRPQSLNYKSFHIWKQFNSILLTLIVYSKKINRTLIFHFRVPILHISYDEI